MSETNPNDDLIARYRAALEPVAPGVDERTLWYEAGRAATLGRGGWLLPAYSGAVTVLAASLAWALVRPPIEEPAASAPPLIVSTPAPAESTLEEAIVPATPAALTPWAKLFPASLPTSSAYAERQRRMLREDFTSEEEIVSTAPFEYEPAPPATRERLLEEYLPDRDLPVPPKPSEGRQNTQQTRPGVKELA